MSLRRHVYSCGKANLHGTRIFEGLRQVQHSAHHKLTSRPEDITNAHTIASPLELLQEA